MGLLDDAIREHLELKRKHGADPEDVARQEQEALGEGPRNEFAQPAGPATLEPEPEPEPDRRPPRPSRSPPPRHRRRRAPTSCPTASPASPKRRPRPRRRATTRTRGWTRTATRSRPTSRCSYRGPAKRTSWRRPRISSRRRPSTNACGSSRSRRATSIGTSNGDPPTLIQGSRRPADCSGQPHPPNEATDAFTARRGPHMPRTALRRVHLAVSARGRRQSTAA